MTRIENNKAYILIPLQEDGIELKSRVLTGKELLAEFKEEALIQALDLGRTTLFYKGNEYFLDEKLDEHDC